MTQADAWGQSENIVDLGLVSSQTLLYSPGSVNHVIISEQRDRKSVKVFKGREGMGDKEEIEMLNSSVEGSKCTSHATNHPSDHQKVRERIMTKSSVSLQTA